MGDQSRQVQVEIGITCRGHKVAVTELRESDSESEMVDIKGQLS
jgi:hypothetical protein